MTFRVVSERSEKEVAEERAREHLDYPLRELAANLMRVAAGAGRPEDIGRQLVKVIDGYQHYKEVVGCYPSSETITELLRVNDGTADLEERCSPEDVKRWEGDGSFSRLRARHQIVKGALRFAAGHLLGQRTQESNGENEIFTGIEAHERARDQRRSTYRR